MALRIFPPSIEERRASIAESFITARFSNLIAFPSPLSIQGRNVPPQPFY
jgi:hypothetical protein